MRQSSRTVRYWSAGIATIVVVIIAVGIGVLGNTSAKGTILPLKSASQLKAQPSTLTLKGKYVTLRYSSRYNTENSQLGDTAAVEQYVLQADADYVKTLAIIVSPLPQGGVASDPGYKMRSLQPALYTGTTMQVGGQQATIMAKNDGTQQVAYLTHGSLMCSIALVTAQPAGDNLTPQMAALLQSFTWNS